MLDSCLWTRTTTRESLVFHLDDLLLAGTHQIIHRSWIEPRPGAQKQRVDGKTDALLGTNLGKDEGRETASELMLRMWNAYCRSSTCPHSRAQQHCDGNAVRQMRRRCLQANKKVYRQLVGKLIWIDRADPALMRWCMPRHALDVRVTRT